MAEEYIDEVQQEQEWTIDSDEKANWALRKIQEAEKEYESIKQQAESEMERIAKILESEKARCDRRTDYLKMLLDDYMDTVECTTTKTGQLKKRLLYGTLVRKPSSISYTRNDEALMRSLMECGRNDLIKTVQTPRWADIKKEIAEGDGEELAFRVTDTGLVIDTATGIPLEGLRGVPTPETFSIQWR